MDLGRAVERKLIGTVFVLILLILICWTLVLGTEGISIVNLNSSTDYEKRPRIDIRVDSRYFWFDLYW